MSDGSFRWLLLIYLALLVGTSCGIRREIEQLNSNVEAIRKEMSK